MKKQYLLVENDEFARYLMVDAIQKIVHGAEVRTHENAKQALNDTNGFHVYDHIFVDLFMPGFSGFELIKLIRKENITTPITIVTVENDRTMLNECIKAGASSILRKPVDKDELHKLLNQDAS